MNTYTWKIKSLDCVLNDKSKVVFCIHWELKGDDGQNTTEAYGEQNIEYNAENPFTVYEALTEQKVIEWLQDSMGVDNVTSLQEALAKRLETLAKRSETLINPLVITPPLPWVE